MGETTDARSERVAARRWLIPFAGFLLTLMGGLLYTWGVFVVPLVNRFGWTTAEATLPFTVMLVVLAIITVPAGKLQDKVGPRTVCMIGAALFLIAWGAAALVPRFPYAWWLLLFVGVVGGAAGGSTYACVAPAARKWFPDKPATAISFGFMGMGLAAVVFAPLMAGFLIPAYGIEGSFLVLAITTSTVTLLAAFLIKNPPQGWTVPHAPTTKAVLIRQELSPGDLPKTGLFWLIWLAFVFVLAGGFMGPSLIPPFGERVLRLTAAEAAMAVAIFAAFNGFGRPVAGMLADRFGSITVMAISFGIQALTLLLFPVVVTSWPLLWVSGALLGWGIAVSVGVFPNLTAICFGVRNLGMNYGLVFTSCAVGAVAPAVGAWLYDITGSYAPAFVSAGVLATLAAALCVVLRKKYGLV